MSDFKILFQDSLGLYFAPLVGAYKAVREELLRFDRERERGEDDAMGHIVFGTVDFRAAARHSLRLYFAPLVGAYKAVREELLRSDSVRGKA